MLGLGRARLLLQQLLFESLLDTVPIEIEIEVIILSILVQIMSFWVHHGLSGLGLLRLKVVTVSSR